MKCSRVVSPVASVVLVFLAGCARLNNYALVLIARPTSLFDLVCLSATHQLHGFVPIRCSGTEKIGIEVGRHHHDALIFLRLTRWLNVSESDVFSWRQKPLITAQGDVALLRIRSMRQDDRVPNLGFIQ